MRKSSNFQNLALIGLMFFAFGFVTWINAILIPFFKIAFDLDHLRAYLVTFAFYISYLTVSIPVSFFLKRKGFKAGMTLGFCIMAMGSLLFIPAAGFRQYSIFLTGLFITGIGLAFVQTAVNPYVTLLGEKEKAAQRISIMGICNKTAGIIAPILFSSLVFLKKDSALLNNLKTLSPASREVFLDELVGRVITPYIIVTVILLLLGLFVRFSSLPEINNQNNNVSANESESKKKIVHYPHVVLGAFAIFFHVGSQVIAIDTIINYARESGLPMDVAKFFPSAILFTTICGYLLGILFVPARLSQLHMLRVCSLLGFSLATLAIFSKSIVMVSGYQVPVSLFFLMLLGLANSMIWACIWPLSLDRLGSKVNIGSSLLVMGLCGNALLPLVYGYLADHLGLQNAYLVLLPCYGYLLFFALRGYKLNTWKFSAV